MQSELIIYTDETAMKNEKYLLYLFHSFESCDALLHSFSIISSICFMLMQFLNPLLFFIF